MLEVTGHILKLALEQCARYFTVMNGQVSISESFLSPKVAHYNYDYFKGVDYVFDLRQPEGQRVVSMTRHGMPISMDDRFTLVMCDYRATGAGDFDFYCDCPRVRDIQTEVSELILSYLVEHPYVNISDTHSHKTLC